MAHRATSILIFLLAAALPLNASAEEDGLPPITINGVSDDATYGYKEANAIKVGGGPARERAYLNLLRGPNGEPVRYSRDGSCCPFETPRGLLGGGMLDIYSVWIGESKDPVKLYINMYDYEQPKAPKGFTYAGAIRT